MKNEKELEKLKQTYNEPHMAERQIEIMKQNIERAKQENSREAKRRKVWFKYGVAAAAVAAFVILPNTSASVAHAMEQIPLLGRLVEVVTVRDYEHEEERHHAHVEVPEVVPGTQSGMSQETQENLQQSAEDINKEIQKISEQFITEFEEGLKDKEGYQDIGVKSEVISTTSDYFTLKLICYQASGSGTQWNYYYTIDLKTGERLQLKELFAEDADYITPISENIKQQMAEQMAADEMVTYWLNQEVEEWNFDRITEETEFYVNENGNVVISFHEGDVAPMYMGVVTFEIPAPVLEGIRK